MTVGCFRPVYLPVEKRRFIWGQNEKILSSCKKKRRICITVTCSLFCIFSGHIYLGVPVFVQIYENSIFTHSSVAFRAPLFVATVVNFTSPAGATSKRLKIIAENGRFPHGSVAFRAPCFLPTSVILPIFRHFHVSCRYNFKNTKIS